MRRGTRNLQGDISVSSEERRLIASSSETLWRMYTGRLNDGLKGRGWDPVGWGGWCITEGLYQERDSLPEGTFIQQASAEYRFIRISDNIIKRHFDPDGWLIIAGLPETHPRMGYLIPLPLTDRSNMGVVQRGERVYNTDKERIRGLKEFASGTESEKSYSGKSDVWVGPIQHRVGGGSAFYDTDGSTDPLLDITRDKISINSSHMKIAAQPRDVTMAGTKRNPLSQEVPSTSVVPVQEWEISLEDVIVRASLI